MSRAEFIETVAVPLGPGGSLIPVPGVATTIFSINTDGSEGQQAEAFAARTGSTPASSLVTDKNGTVSYWLDAGDYNIHVDDQQTPPRIASYVRGFSAQVFDVASLLAAAQNVIMATGDTKFSLQASDHGINPDTNTYEWLLMDSDADGGGRKLLYTSYTGLYNLLYPGIPAVSGQGLDANGYFRLPNVSGRALVAAGAATGLTARTLLQMFGSETHTHTLETLELAAFRIPDLAVAVSGPGVGCSVNVGAHVHSLGAGFAEIAIGVAEFINSGDSAILGNIAGQFDANDAWVPPNAWAFYNVAGPPHPPGTTSLGGFALGGTTNNGGAQTANGGTSGIAANGTATGANVGPLAINGTIDAADSNDPAVGMNLFVKS